MELTNQDVLTASSPSDSEVVKTQQHEAKAEEAAKPNAPAPGAKTPENNLLAALKEEREQRRNLEQRIKQIETSAPAESEEVFSDEGKLLQGHIGSLKSDIERLKEDLELERLYVQHPEIKETATEFQDFKAEYPGLGLDKLARLFLVEKGIHPTLQPRKGLEKSSGGVKTSAAPAMSDDDLRRLREDNPRKYLKLVTEGKV